MASPNSMGLSKCRNHLQVTQGLGILIHPLFTGPRSILIFSPLYEGFYQALVSSRLGMDLVLFWECLSTHDVMTQALQILRFYKNISLSILVEKITYPHATSWVAQTQGIQTVP